MMAREQVLVLNQDYQAIGICNAERAFILVLLQKAEILSENPSRKLRSIHATFSFPSIIRLFRYVAIPFKKVNLSRHNIFRRDQFRCNYCQDQENLTIDHVIPRSLGGRNSWDNLVAACQRCNAQKGNLTPEEAGLTLSTPPFRPSFVMFLSKFSGHIRDDWKPYLYM